jgi:hypothetical protein
LCERGERMTISTRKVSSFLCSLKRRRRERFTRTRTPPRRGVSCAKPRTNYAAFSKDFRASGVIFLIFILECAKIACTPSLFCLCHFSARCSRSKQSNTRAPRVPLSHAHVRGGRSAARCAEQRTRTSAQLRFDIKSKEKQGEKDKKKHIDERRTARKVRCGQCERRRGWHERRRWPRRGPRARGRRHSRPPEVLRVPRAAVGQR